MNKIDILLVSSCGGHLSELLAFKSIWSKYNCRYIINKRVKVSEAIRKLVIFVTHSERDIYFFKNLYEAFQICLKFKPKIIFSTGAGIAVPFSLIGRFFFGCHIIFIESATCIKNPSLTARIMQFIAHDLYVQSSSLLHKLRNSKYVGSLL